MSPPARRYTLRLFLAAALAAACPLPARAQDAKDEILPRADGQKTYLFRSLLKFAGVEPVEGLNRWGDVSDVVLVVFGSYRDRPTMSAEAFRVLSHGGAVLIATDQPANLSNFFPFNSFLRVSGRQVIAAGRNPERCFGGSPDMPYLAPPGEEFANPDLQRMTRLPRVATNSPSSFVVLRNVGRSFADKELAVFPPDCLHPDGGHPQLDSRAVGLVNNPAVDPAGSVAVVYTDAGIFTNQMLTAKGTDNFAYAYFLARYLTSGPDGNRKRTKCLFIENGAVKTDFDSVPLQSSQLPPVPPPPVPSLEQIQDKLTDAGNKAFDELQTRDALGRAAARNFDRIAPVLAAVAAAVVTLVLLRRAWASRHHPEFTTPPPPPADPDDSFLDHRRREVLRANDVYEPLREHLRELFARLGARPGPDLPPVEAKGGPADKRLLVAKLRKLWEIAHGDVPVAVPFIRWKELEPMIESVTRAADAGRWRFAEPGGAA